MSIDVDNALVACWNAAGLNSTIAALHPGDDVAAPDAQPMPRAQYFSQSDALGSESRGTLVKDKTYRIEMFGTDWDTVGGWVKSVYSSILNAEQSDKFQIAEANGRILSTHEVDQGIEKHDDAVFMGFYEFLVRWRKGKVVP